MDQGWEVDLSASLVRRLGKSPQELGNTKDEKECPDVWELSNGDVAMIGTDVTETYRSRLPDGVTLSPGQRIVILPGNTMAAAKEDITDA